MDDKSLNEKLKTAKAVSVVSEKPDGYVYGYLKGKKEFFPIEKMPIASRSNKTVLDLFDKIDTLEKTIVMLEEKLNRRIDEISQAKITD